MSENYKRNEQCIVGLPRCDYVFNSSRSCFIAYGFRESKLEVEILKSILKENNIEVFEAGGDLELGKNVFCVKICSKIITSQFSIVLLNQDTKGKNKIPNANVNMEYGLMLGFHKFIIPFQRDNENLPFNVSGIDTIKYNQSNFKEKAEVAIKQAIEKTTPNSAAILPPERLINSFLQIKDALFCDIEDIGNRNIFDLGQPFGYHLITDFAGIRYIYLGVFNMFSIEQVKWRINKLNQVILQRFGDEAVRARKEFQLINDDGVKLIKKLKTLLSAWIIVQTNSDKENISAFIKNPGLKFEVFSVEEIVHQIQELP